MIVNSGSDERGKSWGGQPGDQTGTEWRLRSWYSCPWDVVLRYPNQNMARDAATLGEHAAANDHIGYNQLNRESFWYALADTGSYDPADISVDCDEDCSAGVTALWKAVGYRFDDQALMELDPSTYTGNLREHFVTAGFTAIWDNAYTGDDVYLMPGDVLLNEGYHTAMNVSVGDCVTDWNPDAYISTDSEPETPVVEEIPAMVTKCFVQVDSKTYLYDYDLGLITEVSESEYIPLKGMFEKDGSTFGVYTIKPESLTALQSLFKRTA